MNTSHRLRLLEILSRKTKLSAEADMQKLRVAASSRDDSSKACKEAEDKAAQALEQIQKQAAPGQPMNLEIMRSSSSYMVDCASSVLVAKQKLRAAEAVVEERRNAVAKQRLRLEKLDDRQRDERHLLEAQQMQQDQHEIDEAWLLSNPGKDSAA